MKRVLNIISQYPGRTGSGTYLQAFIHEGSKKGYTQGLIAALPFGETYTNKYIDKFYPVFFSSNNIPFSIVGMSDVMPYKSTRYIDMTDDMMAKWKNEFKQVVKRAITEFKPDLIITHHLWLSTSIVTSVSKGIKTIGICHGTDIRQLLNNPKYKIEVIEGCKKLDLVLSLNHAQSEEIENIYGIEGERIKVVGGGYRDDYFYMADEISCNKRIKLIYAGKLSRAKGLISLIKVFNEIQKNYDMELIIAGEGVGNEEEYIKEIGSGSNIKFLGEVSQEKLGELFRNSDIFVMPSFYEGLSLVTLEALASGLLVVATEIPGLKSFLHGELSESGIVEFVPLPIMVDVDHPLDDSLPEYENLLGQAIVKQIERCIDGDMVKSTVIDTIVEKSWKNIFGKIESYI